MIDLKFDYSNALGTVTQDEINHFQNEIIQHYNSLNTKSGKGNDFLGWVDIPSDTDERLIKKIEEVASRVRQNSKVFVVVGIGGSYLGAR
ncbi:MAG: glucose-6-phosphate isomerase, partial [Lentimicrobiaceae bacterium]|nr:glucose-6-phosphate isomerase [Lentimicrobiaceae bacterium]MBT4061058.1 glucose-6-phosphate isomerase [Lentimicrobiaceae bacterium]